ncbi:MAG: YeeE/YedE family protein, partial [Rhodoferax sp.]|nr:YeeE/YedE family protein [Rhodoferax sp.]
MPPAPSDVASLQALVLACGWGISLLLGVLLHRTHFCAMGAVSDIVSMNDWTRMRQWALAAGVALAGFALLVRFGGLPADRVLYASSRWAWLSALLGGGLFGLGMVLASGCGAKSLVRAGAGSLKSLVVLVVMGLSAFATLKGITAVLRANTADRVALDVPAPGTLPQLLSQLMGWPAGTTALALGLVLALALGAWALWPSGFRRIPNLVAGTGVGLLVVAMWWVSGVLGHVGEHPETLQEAFLGSSSGRAEALSFVAPVAYGLDWLLFFSDASKVLSLGVVSVAGVLCGSAVSAWHNRSFRWEGFADVQDLARHLVGAALM